MLFGGRGGCLKNNLKYPFGLPVVSLLALLICSINAYAQDSSTCLDCHEDVAASLMNTPHELRTVPEGSASRGVACIDCHNGWQEHIGNPSRENIEKGSDLLPLAETELCGRCHVTPHQAAMTAGDPHFNSRLSCSSCHTIHGNLNDNLVKEDLDNYCVSCHSATAMEFERRSAHPLESGNIRCVDCHKLGSSTTAEFKVGFDWRCQSCHEDQAGPFIYEHPVVYNHLTEGGSCTECHEPHGSVNDRLMRQSGRTLCLQCHSVPAGHMTNHSGLGSKFACVRCHSEIHGSYSNWLFLDPELGDKLFPDCYQSGCHSIGN
jgi:DmsE family decaheme c-type cytochrome